MDMSLSRFRYVGAGDLTEDTIGFNGLAVRSSSQDEELGTVRGFIVDADSGQLHYVVVNAGGWFTSDSYLIPPAYTRVDAEQQVLWTDATRDTIRRFPAFDSDTYPTLSEEQLWPIERRIIEAYGDDPGVVAPSATWDRRSWAHYRQPEWWRLDYLGTRTSSPRGSAVTGSAAAAGRTAPAERTMAVGSTREAWPNPEVERAQPGDILGIERGGETTSLGDTARDEDQRREAAEKDFEQIREDDAREAQRRREDR
jgi:hypothetical protein